MNSVSDIYGPDEIEELLEDLNRLEMASFDGVMMFDQASMPPDPDDLLSMRPTSSEMNIMQNEAVISGCITQPPDDDVEDFDIDGSQVRKETWIMRLGNKYSSSIKKFVQKITLHQYSKPKEGTEKLLNLLVYERIVQRFSIKSIKLWYGIAACRVE